MPGDFIPNVEKRIMCRERWKELKIDFESMMTDLSEEVGEDHQFSMRKSIGKCVCVGVGAYVCACVCVSQDT